MSVFIKEVSIKLICTPLDDYDGEFEYSKDNRRGLIKGNPTSDKAGIVDFLHILTDTAIADSLPAGHVITVVTNFKDITEEVFAMDEQPPSPEN